MNFPIDMYRIVGKPLSIRVVCSHCYERGYVDPKCKKCGGKGTHKKTLMVWKVDTRPEKVVKIDRTSRDYLNINLSKGELRYWTSLSDFYAEDSKLLHFSIEMAQKECDARNAMLQPVINCYTKQKNKK